MSSYLDQTIAKLKEFEGSVPWMYLDTVGRVTVGVGLMLPNATSAVALPFMNGDRRATAEEIEKEFARISALAKGKTAKFYKKDGGIRLSEEAIDERLRGVLAGFEGYLKTHVPGYDRLPDVAKMALLDMIYNLGPGRLFEQFPRLLAAVGTGDWRRAAEMCSRRGPGPQRNEWTKDQFLAAAKEVSIKAEAAVERAAAGWMPALLGVGAGLAALWAATLPRRRDPDGSGGEQF